MEDLADIRETTKRRKKQRGVFHSWSFYQLRKFIEYKAQAKGIPILLIKRWFVYLLFLTFYLLSVVFFSFKIILLYHR